MVQSATLRRPDSMHLHLRDDAMLRTVLPYSVRHFGRAIVMPNLKPPVTTVAAGGAYRQRILDALPQGTTFEPLMTCYLCDGTDQAETRAGVEERVFTAVKLYPAGATTHSEYGVTAIDKVATPHERRAKEAACGCAGIFSTATALEAHMTVFDEEHALDHFEAFASENGRLFYGLPPNEGTVTLTRDRNDAPRTVTLCDVGSIETSMGGGGQRACDNRGARIDSVCVLQAVVSAPSPLRHFCDKPQFYRDDVR